MAQDPLVLAKLAMVSIEAFLYGIFLILTVLSLYLLVRRERTVNPYIALVRILCRPMVLSSIFMTLVVTAHWILTVYNSFMAFIHFENGAIPILYYGNIGGTAIIAQDVFLDCAVLTFDAVMIYRVWIIWNKHMLPVVLPMISLIGGIACSAGQNYAFSQFRLGDNIYATRFTGWVSSATVLTLFTNLACSVLITWKLWVAHSRIKTRGTSLLWVCAVIVESAAIYLAWSIVFFASLESKLNIQDAFLDIWAVIAGIAFMLINVRIGAGWGAYNKYPRSIGTVGTGQFLSRDEHPPPAVYEMSPVTIKMTRMTESDDARVTGSKPGSLGGSTSTAGADALV